ncbi:hypothetical protein SASPL_118074 [Salvia splendens]|uniref:Uncharacterized protein n=1 Tax=Salvia splendens TaxID=180675 RepID=A0A8X8Y0Y4_SALSN|nr:hypothetical protein SASPL_118074 [Salvia splendens]
MGVLDHEQLALAPELLAAFRTGHRFNLGDLVVSYGFKPRAGQSGLGAAGTLSLRAAPSTENQWELLVECRGSSGSHADLSTRSSSDGDKFRPCYGAGWSTRRRDQWEPKGVASCSTCREQRRRFSLADDQFLSPSEATAGRVFMSKSSAEGSRKI